MKKLTILVSAEIEVQYDENSPEFKEALEAYNEVISDGNAVDMVSYAVAQLRVWGDHQSMIEGVGYVGLIDNPLPKKLYCGIQVSPNYDARDFEVQEEDE
ncbi:hypothetical protein [Hymenobacter sp. BT491]|uniref:hypothetical protein n=1 Tax=Hymenobacter sp. BT491 TaxID=2766779 RepID=UPI001653B2FD|nr:hypothetical protein [Hymenobacter sp. BT491]MBC6988550.1 hypothetical protein [Hymenobacter sp. BT491]